MVALRSRQHVRYCLLWRCHLGCCCGCGFGDAVLTCCDRRCVCAGQDACDLMSDLWPGCCSYKALERHAASRLARVPSAWKRLQGACCSALVAPLSWRTRFYADTHGNPNGTCPTRTVRLAITSTRLTREGHTLCHAFAASHACQW